MNIYIYSDESGVFDKYHNEIFVFGGIAFLGKSEKDLASRNYIGVENIIRRHGAYRSDVELKASLITNSEKYKLYRSLNNYYKFGVIIKQDEVFDRIFDSKKDKQRYLDYAYKIAIKRFFVNLISNRIIKEDDEISIYFFVDEHTTATNGRYELKDALEQELKRGTFNYDYSCWHEPIFANLKNIDLTFCNSSSKTLIRAADIIANNIYYKARINDTSIYNTNNKFLHVIKLP